VLLLLSPAFGGELMTSSDGLSNAFFVFSLILLFEKKVWTDGETMGRRWVLVAVVAGLVACTRLSAVIPFALYLFGRYVRSDVKTLIGFPLIVTAVVGAMFAPYILWDTETWVWFSRNPFMSQSTLGNVYILLPMVAVAVVLAVWKKDFRLQQATTGVFMFCFMLVSMLGVIMLSDHAVSLFSIECDISYLSLSLPFCLHAAALLMEDDKAGFAV
jgi:hypothetical protein